MGRHKITDGTKLVQVYIHVEERAVDLYGKPAIQKKAEKKIKEDYFKDVRKLPKPK